MKMKKILSCLLAVTVIGAAFAGCSGKKDDAADASLTKVKEAGVFILGLDTNFPPMGFSDDKGTVVGFDIDVAKEVCKRMGVELKTQSIDWNSKKMELDTGKIDCIWNGFTITDDNKKEVNFSDPYLKNRQVVVVLADSAIQTLDDLKDKKVGVQSGSSASEVLDGKPELKNSMAEVLSFSDYNKALMDLETKGADAIIMDEIVANYKIQQGKKDYKLLDESLADEEYGIGFRKADNALKNEVNKQLKAMAADGTLAKISTQWFGKDITTVGK